MVGIAGVGIVAISIDLELEIDYHTSRRQDELEMVRDQLGDLLKMHRIPATWSVADPARSAASDPILASGIPHEIAVLGDRSWVGHGTGRLRLARELARRFEGARRVGIAASTLALRGCDILPELDLLLSHGVTAIRSPTSNSTPRQGSPQSRYGIWQAPAGRTIPSPRSWWNLSNWAARREILRAIRTGTILHFEIDAPQLLAAGAPGLQQIEELAGCLSQHRDAGRLRFATLAALAADNLRQRAATPTHSILRPAA